LKAPQQFGEWSFTGWVDQNGKQLSTDADYQAGYINSNKYFKATYDKIAASLEVAPSHNVPKEKGYLQIKVENGGTVNLDWAASTDESALRRNNEEPWFKIKAGKYGLNDGYITVEFDNNDNVERSGILKISSNAGDKEVVITQNGGMTTDIGQDGLTDRDHVTVYVRDNNLCYVDLGKQASAIRVELYDLNGRAVKQFSAQHTRTFDFDISNLISGAYIFKAVYDDNTWSQKIMKY